jgi:hypothetical protein
MPAVALGGLRVARSLLAELGIHGTLGASSHPVSGSPLPVQPTVMAKMVKEEK